MTIHMSSTPAAYPSASMFACSQGRMPTSPKCSRKKQKRIDDALERLPDRNATVAQDSQPGLFRSMRVEALIDVANRLIFSRMATA
jgi:hypothetical protein